MPHEIPDFFNHFPTHQNAIDLFRGEWSTRLPDSSGLVASEGVARHCEDYRVAWAEQEMCGFAGKRILELGPLEGGHAFMLEQMGAGEILAVEGSGRAYLKCLVIKEAFGLTRVRFLLGGFLPYLRDSSRSFDVGFACGVLYHQANPVELIQLLAKTCSAVFVWSHYYDAAYLEKHPIAAAQFEGSITATVAGFSHQLHRRHYAGARAWKGFCGGGESVASWLTDTAILDAFNYFGFTVGATLREDNPNGPALMFVAHHRA